MPSVRLHFLNFLNFLILFSRSLVRVRVQLRSRVQCWPIDECARSLRTVCGIYSRLKSRNYCKSSIELPRNVLSWRHDKSDLFFSPCGEYYRSIRTDSTHEKSFHAHSGKWPVSKSWANHYQSYRLLSVQQSLHWPLRWFPYHSTTGLRQRFFSSDQSHFFRYENAISDWFRAQRWLRRLRLSAIS